MPSRPSTKKSSKNPAIPNKALPDNPANSCNAIKRGSATVTFGSIDDISDPISNPPANALSLETKTDNSFGAINAETHVNSSAKLPKTDTTELLRNPSPLATQKAKQGVGVEKKNREEEWRRKAEEEEKERVQKDAEAKEWARNAEEEGKERKRKAKKEKERKRLKKKKAAKAAKAANEAEEAAKTQPAKKDGKLVKEPRSVDTPHEESTAPTKELLHIITSEDLKKRPGRLDLSNNSRFVPAPFSSALSTARNIEDLGHVSYPEGISKPKPELNFNAKDGKFRYDRDFLLQFMAICKEKPEMPSPFDQDTGTELFSPKRKPFPRCYEGTCDELIQEILSGEDTDVNVRWITGPPGSGKSALAQTIGEKGCVAAFFFSRLLGFVDPSRLWISISRQAEKGITDWGAPGTWQSRLSLQMDFERCITAPAASLNGFPQGFIIIDGLDECRGESEQSQIVDCIFDSIRRSSWLRWMIFSRPEPHLRLAFERAREEGVCWIKELRVDSPEMKRDVKEYVEKEFRRIAMAYIADVKVRDHWPSQEVMGKLLKAVSGLFIYAVTIIKFIGDPRAADPVNRLQRVIEAIEGAPVPEGAINPIGAIDTLYRTLIERTPPATLPLTLNVLGMLTVCPPLPPLHLACLLDVDTLSILDALISLHSVVAVPSSSKVGEITLHYYHASFADFLINPSHAGSYHQSPTVYRNRLAASFVRILSDGPERMRSVQGSTQRQRELSIEPPLSVFMQLVHVACRHLWQICTQIANPETPFLGCARGFEHFMFATLRTHSGLMPTESFLVFLRCLYQSTRNNDELKDLVRTTASSNIGLDSQFIIACEGISKPLDLNQDESSKDNIGGPRYALLGHDMDTVLILAVPEAVMIFSSEDIDNI